jgi:hypothetical protein
MLPNRIPTTLQPTKQGLSALLLVLLVSTSLFIGTVGTAAADPAPADGKFSVDADDNDEPLVHDGKAVNNNTVVVNSDGVVVSGKQVSYGDPTGKPVRNYSFNGIYETESLRVRDGNVVTETGQNVIVDGGSVGAFDEEPDIRARFENGTVEELVVNGSNIETASGVNVKTEEGDNIEINRDTFNDNEFVVDIRNASYVGEGVTMDVTTKLGNIGHTEGEKEVALIVDSRTYERQMIELDPGETKEVEFQYPTFSGDAPEVELTVETPDDSETATAAVAEPDFQIDITEPELAVAAGETVTVPVSIDRTGGAAEQTYAIDFVADGTIIDTELLTLDRGGGGDLEFSYETESEDTPSVLATIRGPDNANATQEIPVRNPILAVNQVYTPANISEYEQVEVTATVENYDTDKKNQTVQLAISENGSNGTTIVDAKQVKVGNRSAKNVSFTYHTKPEYHPRHTLIIQTKDHEREVDVQTNPAAVFRLPSGPEGNLTASPGSEHTLAPTIKNSGHKNGTAELTYQIDGSIEHTQNISIAAKNTGSSEFAVDVPANSSVGYKIATQHTNVSGTITATSPDDASESTSTTPPADTQENGTTSTNSSENSGGNSGGFLGLSLPSIPVMIATSFSVLLVTLIAHIAS